MRPDRVHGSWSWRYAVPVRPWHQRRSYADGWHHGFAWGCLVSALVLVWGMWWLGPARPAQANLECPAPMFKGTYQGQAGAPWPRPLDSQATSC